MPDNEDDMRLSRSGAPTCETCDSLMRLVGTEPDEANARASLHTYECACGAGAVIQVTQVK